MPYPGIDGFLGTRASLMLDVVVLAMVAVLPALGWSIAQVKYRRRYLLHKRLQLALGLVLLATVLLFEADMRVNGWRERAAASPFWSTESTNWVDCMLGVHIFFSVTTAALWIAVTGRALSRFDRVPRPNAHSAWHRRWGQVAALDMLLTAVTGWLFYWMAFVAG